MQLVEPGVVEAKPNAVEELSTPRETAKVASKLPSTPVAPHYTKIEQEENAGEPHAWEHPGADPDLLPDDRSSSDSFLSGN